jgi:dinuclear metal center YbgI/SA1388 family protein
MNTESLAQYLNEYLSVEGFADYAPAHNGLQVEGPTEVSRAAVAVDASEAVIREAVSRGVDVLIVHHGLFWDGQAKLVGPRFRKIRALIEGKVALYSAHLPLDSHPEVGNCAVLCRALGWSPAERFGSYQDRDIGWSCTVDFEREALAHYVGEIVGGPVRLIPGGPERVYRVGVVTGAAANLIPEASLKGLDALITGEGPHHTFHDAMEYGVNALYAGHYATETWGVRALGRHLEERFALEQEFIDLPTGL